MSRQRKRQRSDVTHVLNSYGIDVKVCCASCGHKMLTRAFSLRRCRRLRKNVKPSGCCRYWEMNEALKSAGCSLGAVRDKDTKEILIS